MQGPLPETQGQKSASWFKIRDGPEEMQSMCHLHENRRIEMSMLQHQIKDKTKIKAEQGKIPPGHET